MSINVFLYQTYSIHLSKNKFKGLMELLLIKNKRNSILCLYQRF